MMRQTGAFGFFEQGYCHGNFSATALVSRCAICRYNADDWWVKQYDHSTCAWDDITTVSVGWRKSGIVLRDKNYRPEKISIASLIGCDDASLIKFIAINSKWDFEIQQIYIILLQYRSAICYLFLFHLGLCSSLFSCWQIFFIQFVGIRNVKINMNNLKVTKYIKYI